MPDFGFNFNSIIPLVNINPNDKPDDRKCLRCGKIFKSPHFGKRRCPKCSERLMNVDTSIFDRWFNNPDFSQPSEIDA